ncbi:Protein transport protein Sec24A [Ranunculus cassubicifolius]
MSNRPPFVNEKTGQYGFPGRSASPVPSGPQATPPFASPRPLVGADPSGYGAASQPRFNGLLNPPPQVPYSTDVGFNPRITTPHFPPPVQSVPSIASPSFPSSASQQPRPPPGSYRPHTLPSAPMRPPMSAPPPPPSSAQPYYPITTQSPQAPLQSSTQPYYPISKQAPPPSPFVGRQGGYAPSAPPLGMDLREQMQAPSRGPPTGTLQGLVEDFSSLSVASVPGSIDRPGVDAKSLPRPLDGDVVPKAFSEMYPLNCDPRYLRLTTSAIPNSQSLHSRWHLPLAAVVHPFAEAPDGEEVPVVNLGSTGIIRCRRCLAYVNPYVTFTDGGRQWRCNICSLHNDVPGEYFAYLDANGRRTDLDHRPELTKGSVDFVASTEFMARAPMPPVYFFLIDVSVTAVRSGMLEIVAETIKSCLDEMQGYPRTQIGFITFDSTLHFYNMKSSLSQPQMMVVADLEDVFIPLPNDLLVNLSESRNVVESFLDNLPSMFKNNVNVESAFGPALRAAFMVMSQLGGKLLIFQSTLPSLGVGRLRLRGDDPRVYGTDREHVLRVPEESFYKQRAADLTKCQICVNVYTFSDKYTDVASLGTLAKYTGGQVYYYQGFQAEVHGEKLRYELSRDLTRETAWESVMRIRCGKGVRFTSYHGHYLLRASDLVALPAVDCDKAFVAQLSLEDQLLMTQVVYFQVALLYTSSSGERRIRVHTAAAPVVTDLAEMYRMTDIGVVVTCLSRLAIERSLSHKLEDSRQTVQSRIVKALKEYRSLYAMQHRLGGRMIYPDSLKFLILYGLAIYKSVPLDERCAIGYTMMTMCGRQLLKLLYPSLTRIDDYLLKASADAEDFGNGLEKLPLTRGSLDVRGLYLYDDGLHFVIWFGANLSPDIAHGILGDLSGLPDFSRVYLRENDNHISRKLMALLKKLRKKEASNYQMCYLVRQGEQPRESALLLGNLVEDQIGGTNGYLDWMLQIHRQIQQTH